MKLRLKIAIARRAFAVSTCNMIDVAGYNEIISRTVIGLAQGRFM